MEVIKFAIRSMLLDLDQTKDILRTISSIKFPNLKELNIGMSKVEVAEGISRMWLPSL